MSIKPVAWVSGTLIAGRCAGSMAYANRNSEEQMPLYSIPDTHRVVPVEPAPEMIAAALPSAMRESDEDKYRAIGEIICIWDEMLAAHSATESQGGQ